MTRPAWDALHAHASREAPHECCGLLIGRAAEVVIAWPARNGAAARSVRYEVDPEDHLAAVRHARGLELEVVGAYHSHPRSAPLPSPTDRAEALAGFLYVIAGRTDETSWLTRAFYLVDGNFEERILVHLA